MLDVFRLNIFRGETERCESLRHATGFPHKRKVRRKSHTIFSRGFSVRKILIINKLKDMNLCKTNSYLNKIIIMAAIIAMSAILLVGVQTAFADTIPVPCECANPVTETMFSDTSNTVVGGGNAVALTFIHPAWTASIPGATWIWEEDPVNPVLETKSFEKSFTVVGTVLSAQLDIATDNSYKVFIDNIEVAADPAENNFQLATQDTHNLTVVVTPGTHTLRIEVSNHPGSNDPQNNPAGLLYKFEVKACPPKCCGGEVTVTNNNTAVVINNVSTQASTGGNNAGGSNGGNGGNGGSVSESGSSNNGGRGGRGGNGGAGGVVITGNASANSGVLNKVNTNITRIRR